MGICRFEFIGKFDYVIGIGCDSRLLVEYGLESIGDLTELGGTQPSGYIYVTSNIF